MDPGRINNINMLIISTGSSILPHRDFLFFIFAFFIIFFFIFAFLPLGRNGLAFHQERKIALENHIQIQDSHDSTKQSMERNIRTHFCINSLEIDVKALKSCITLDFTPSTESGTGTDLCSAKDGCTHQIYTRNLTCKFLTVHSCSPLPSCNHLIAFCSRVITASLYHSRTKDMQY